MRKKSKDRHTIVKQQLSLPPTAIRGSGIFPMSSDCGIGQ